MLKEKLHLPAIVPFPPQAIREKIGKGDWVSCCDTWKLTIRFYLSLKDSEFSTAIVSSPSFLKFVTSYLNAISSTDSNGSSYLGLASERVSSDVFSLILRLFCESAGPPTDLLTGEFLGTFSLIYRHHLETPQVIRKAWSYGHALLEPSIKTQKDVMLHMLNSMESLSTELNPMPQWLLPFLRFCPPAAKIFVTGSELIDSIASNYDQIVVKIQSSLTVLLYLGFVSLIDGESPNFSLLFDHLYNLKVDAELKKLMDSPQVSMLSSLVTNTPLLSRIQSRCKSADGSRLPSLLPALSTFNDPNSKLRNRKGIAIKNKERENSEYSPKEMNIHQASSIIQIQDIFPDLGSAFITKLLDYFNNDIEQVTAHLLENNIPEILQNVDRSENISSSKAAISAHVSLDMLPRVTPPTSPSATMGGQLPRRRNIHDNDDFDRLAIPASHIHTGRKTTSEAADNILSLRGMDEDSKNTRKAAILSALAAFDADDDEHDDTYDLDDVGGTIDVLPTDADIHTGAEKELTTDGILYNAWRSQPEIFQRSGATRRENARHDLREATGMTDEGIEGWAIMIARDPARLRRLENHFWNQTGSKQPSLKSTKWAMDSEDQTEGSGDDDRESQFKRATTRRTHGEIKKETRDGGGVENKHTSRQQKEFHKASRSNHNRRNQRMKKIAGASYTG